jgi:hypothetical protein
MKGEKTIILPNPHHGEDISVDFLARFLRDAGISVKNGFLQNSRSPEVIPMFEVLELKDRTQDTPMILMRI